MRPLEIVERANRAMHEIKSGLFAREWEAEQKAGKPRLKQLWQDAQNHPLTQAETKLEPLRKAIAAMIEED